MLEDTCGKLWGQRKAVPTISPNKTLEGYVGGGLLATGLGAAPWWATPFRPGQAALLALVIVLAGIAGGLVLSAVNRDRGGKDFGASLPGHGGVLDRIASRCIAAPLFFHLTRFFFTCDPSARAPRLNRGRPGPGRPARRRGCRGGRCVRGGGRSA